MKCSPEITANGDMVYWVTWDQFTVFFDMSDFMNRNCSEPRPLYLQDWFTVTDSRFGFLVATVQIIGGRPQFINGRHRTAVLFGHLKIAPIAFANPFSSEVADFIARARLQPLSENEIITIPDLPIINDRQI